MQLKIIAIHLAELLFEVVVNAVVHDISLGRSSGVGAVTLVWHMAHSASSKYWEMLYSSSKVTWTVSSQLPHIGHSGVGIPLASIIAPH
jgi:hypothetical protein